MHDTIINADRCYIVITSPGGDLFKAEIEGAHLIAKFSGNDELATLQYTPHRYDDDENPIPTEPILVRLSLKEI